MRDVVVIGSGISGLSCAWRLMQQGRNVQVLENADAAGGHTRTIEHNGYIIENAYHCFPGEAASVWQLIEELDIEDLCEQASIDSNNRFVFHNGRLHPLPESFWGFFASRILSLKAKLRLVVEPIIPNGSQPGDSVWNFAVRRFGEETAEFIVAPLVSQIFAGESEQLGVRATFPKHYKFERDFGSVFIGAIRETLTKHRHVSLKAKKNRKGYFSCIGGLGVITTTLATKLRERLTLNADVTSVSPHEGTYLVHTARGEIATRCVICATPPHEAAKLFGELVPVAAQVLNTIPMSPVSLVHWSQSGQKSSLPLGFGVLMPRHDKLRLLKTVFASQLFSKRAPDGKVLLCSYYGGMSDKHAMQLDDAELSELVIREHCEVFGYAPDQPEIVKVLRHGAAIPQFQPDHPEKMEKIAKQLKEAPGVFLAGSYLKGVGMEDAVLSGFDAADQVAKIFAKDMIY